MLSNIIIEYVILILRLLMLTAKVAFSCMLEFLRIDIPIFAMDHIM